MSHSERSSANADGPSTSARSRPSCPAPPVINTRTGLAFPGAQRLPPPSVGAIPLDRLRQRVVEGPPRHPSERLRPLGIHRVPAVVAGAVRNGGDQRVGLTEQIAERARQIEVRP